LVKEDEISMTIESARDVLTTASGVAPRKIRGARRGWVRRAVKFVRRSGRHTFNDLELAVMVEGMLDRNETRWPHRHEIAHFVVRSPMEGRK
jgi:hypothetical protein